MALFPQATNLSVQIHYSRGNPLVPPEKIRGKYQQGETKKGGRNAKTRSTCRGSPYPGGIQQIGEESPAGAHVCGGFIRCCVDNVQIREGPSADVPLLLREVRQNSVLLDQLVQARGEVEGVRLAQLLEQMQEVERMIVEAYSPR